MSSWPPTQPERAEKEAATHPHPAHRGTRHRSGGARTGFGLTSVRDRAASVGGRSGAVSTRGFRGLWLQAGVPDWRLLFPRICPSRRPWKTRVRSWRAASTLAMLRASLPRRPMMAPLIEPTAPAPAAARSTPPAAAPSAAGPPDPPRHARGSVTARDCRIDLVRSLSAQLSRCQLGACQGAGRLDQGILCALPRGSGRVKGHHSRPGRAGIAARGRAEAVPHRLPQRSPGIPGDRAVPSGTR